MIQLGMSSLATQREKQKKAKGQDAAVVEGLVRMYEMVPKHHACQNGNVHFSLDSVVRVTGECKCTGFFILSLSFLIVKYFSSQPNHTQTIEGVLFQAMVRAGAVSQDNADDPVKVSTSNMLQGPWNLMTFR